MNTEAARIFSSLILSEKTVRIKLLGDSITHGVGGTGFAQDGEPITQGFARNPEGFCWAKLLKDYLESRFDCRVVNNGCTGTTIDFVLERFDRLVEPEDDIVLCVIGTNNRHQYFADGPKPTKRAHMARFYQCILQLHARFQAAGKAVIFVANVPAGNQNEQDGEEYWRLFRMNDVQDLYVKASFACGFPLIPLYTLFLQHCERSGLAVDDLLKDGLHPNDAGYEVMFRLIMDQLGIARKVPGATF